MDLKDIGIITRNWVDLAQDRDLLESPCECGIKPVLIYDAIICLQNSKKSPKKQCNPAPNLESLSGEDPVILMPGTFDVILLVDKKETSG